MQTKRSDIQYRNLDSLADVAGGVALGSSVPSGASVELPYLRVANVQDGYITTNEVKTLRVPMSSAERFHLRRGDVLLTEGGDFDKLGRGAVWDGRIDPCIHQNHVFRVRCYESELIPEYLALYMASPEGRAYFLRIAKQTTNLATISLSQLKAMPVPHVPLAKQRRIVDALVAVAELINHESQASRKEAALWDGFVNAAFDRHLQEFGAVQLREVSMGGGAYGSSSPAVPYVENSPRYVRITDIDDQGSLVTGAGMRVGIASRALSSYLLRPGDLLIARTGFTTGKSYLYHLDDGPCVYAGYLIRFRLNPKKMIAEYAFLWTRANYFRQWLAQNLREVGQRNISAREYDTHCIALPPIETQRELVARWRKMRASIQLGDEQVAKLKEMKRALVDDLLSGSGRMDLRTPI